MACVLLLLTACEPDVPKSTILQRIESALLARKSFTVAEADVPGVVFYCVCGPYTNCDEKSKTLADKLGYELPPYKFRLRTGDQWMLFFKRNEIIEVNVDRSHFWIAYEHEEFCSTDMNLTIPRRR